MQGDSTFKARRTAAHAIEDFPYLLSFSSLILQTAPLEEERVVDGDPEVLRFCKLDQFLRFEARLAGPCGPFKPSVSH